MPKQLVLKINNNNKQTRASSAAATAAICINRQINNTQPF